MRISLKFTFAFLIIFSLILAGDAYFRIQREADFFEQDMRHDHATAGREFAAAVTRTWESSGRAAAANLIAGINRADGGISMHWIDVGSGPGSGYQPVAPQLARRALQTDREVTSEILKNHGEGLLCSYVPIRVAGDVVGALELSESLAENNRYIRGTMRSVLANALIVLVVTGTTFAVLGYWIVGRPMTGLIQMTSAIAQGGFETRLHLRQRDEMGRLAHALNAMCDQLVMARNRVAEESAARMASLDQLRHADRLATVGQFASEFAHELGTPLNVVAARAKLISAQPAADPEVLNHARIVVEQAERMTRTIRQLLDFARPQAPRRTRVDLREILKRAGTLLSAVAQGSGVTLNLEPSGTPLWIDADPDQLQQVVANLVVNAVQATAPGGEVQVGCGLESVSRSADIERPAGRYCCVYVADHGRGISAEDLPHVFEPFFTTKQVGIGTGLGLSVSRGIIVEHRGWIQVESEIGKGSRFTVYLPEGPAHEEPNSRD